MEYITKPDGANIKNILKIQDVYNVNLSIDLINWWKKSDGPIVYFGFKELQFFSVDEIIEDIYLLKEFLPNAIPICLDGSANICVAKVLKTKIQGYYIVSCGDLDWNEATFIADTLLDLINDNRLPESLLNA